jgi:hypothetical protein
MKRQASDYVTVRRDVGLGPIGKSRVKHKNRAAFKIALMGRWAGAGGCQSFFILKNLKQQGRP